MKEKIMPANQPQEILLDIVRTQLRLETEMIPKRPGDVHNMEMMDCPVFLLQQWQEECDDHDQTIGYWKTTEGAWFTRAEAEAWAQAHAYRMGKWRVYGIGARGDLKTLLKAHTDYQ